MIDCFYYFIKHTVGVLVLYVATTNEEHEKHPKVSTEAF